MLNRIKSFVSASAVPGRLASSLGSALFGAKKFLEYATRSPLDNSVYSHPYAIASAVVNVTVNLLTKIPAMMRSHDTEIVEVSEEDNTNETDSSIDIIINQDEQDIEPIPAQDEENNSSCLNKKTCYSTLLNILCHATNVLAGLGVFIGSYNSGKVLCDFVATQLNEQTNDAEWKYYLIHGVALYIAVSNVYTYASYSGKSMAINKDKLVTRLTSENPAPINKKIATTTLILASLNVISSTGFNYLSSQHALSNLENDIINFPLNTNHTEYPIPDWVIMLISSSTCAGSFINEIMTSIPSLYHHLEDMFCNDDLDPVLDAAAPSPPWTKAIKAVAYPIGGADAINTGVQGAGSVILTMNDLAGVNPYGYIISLGFLCAVSKIPSHFSFNVKKGVDDFIGDLVKFSNRYASQPTHDEENVEEDRYLSSDEPSERTGLLTH